jgi:rhamnogalacturonyl hydrolase YesR
MKIYNVDYENIYSDLLLKCYQEIKATKRKPKQLLKDIIKWFLFGYRNNKDNYFWDRGMIAFALVNDIYIFNNAKSIQVLRKYFNSWNKKNIIIDHMLNAYNYVIFKKYIESGSKTDFYESYFKDFNKFIDGYPKDRYSSLVYSKNISDQVLIDTIGLSCPYLSLAGVIEKRFRDLGMAQIDNFFKFGFDNLSNLPYHGYNSNSLEKLGIIGWSRGVGWILIGYVKLIMSLDNSSSDYITHQNRFELICNNVLTYQRENGSFSWMLPAIEGHEDTSATAMISYAILNAISMKILKEELIAKVEKSIDFLLGNIDNDNVKNSLAECKGISEHPQKYEKNKWGLGATTLALSEFIKIKGDMNR